MYISPMLFLTVLVSASGLGWGVLSFLIGKGWWRVGWKPTAWGHLLVFLSTGFFFAYIFLVVLLRNLFEDTPVYDELERRKSISNWVMFYMSCFYYLAIPWILIATRFAARWISSRKDKHSTPYERFQAASNAYGEICKKAPERWHRPDVAKFTALQRELLPKAESGDMHCQYALATMLSIGLCCESEEHFLEGHAAAQEAATHWWIKAAKQGYLPALDNLITSGTGAEVQRARDLSRQLEQERPDLVGSSQDMPVYGPDFLQALGQKLYGCSCADEA
jgi:hypothetical protein